MFSSIELLSKYIARTTRKVLGVKIRCYSQIGTGTYVGFYRARLQPTYVRMVPAPRARSCH